MWYLPITGGAVASKNSGPSSPDLASKLPLMMSVGVHKLYASARGVLKAASVRYGIAKNDVGQMGGFGL